MKVTKALIEITFNDRFTDSYIEDILDTELILKREILKSEEMELKYCDNCEENILDKIIGDVCPKCGKKIEVKDESQM